ncbi:hypothetical protein QF205_04020 [Luteimonas composti]|uniref:Peptidoglycan-binding protein n=1 Tax=Luteimonas composti TaxID=398257 RepID=A0ABT6MNT0_9GAMM|nr:hypothetical protein [Luteimonas composti]MDH7452250.1 hypothetical protein [Luteimonas composti]
MNPYDAVPTDIDIRASADRVISQLRDGHTEEGFRLLERVGQSERLVVREALHRYVAAAVLRDGDPSSQEARAADGYAATQLERALGPPRVPDYGRTANESNELAGLTEAQKYHVYASMVEVRGNETARTDLQRDNHVVLLGLRRETSTLSSPGNGRAGTGVYDDQMVVLGRTADGGERVFIALASTEPTAQYSHQAGSDGNRRFSGGDRENRVIAPAPGYEAVRWRKIEGEEVNGDTMLDLGRLAEGTIEMFRAEHPNPRSVGTRDAFRPSPEQMTRTAGMVQRDTNGDGYFTPADPSGVQALNGSFKIHSGSVHNTDSAGCQTIHPRDYRGFIDAAQRNPAQTRWQYVLTSTRGGLFHNVEVGRQSAADTMPGPADRQDERQANGRAVQGPFEDPGLNRYYEAVLSGRIEQANRIALGFAFREPEPALHRAAAAVAPEPAPASAEARAQPHGAPVLQP